MKGFFVLYLLCLTVLTFSQDHHLNWVRSVGGSSADESHAVHTDVCGNIYTTGGFRGTVDFDPGAGTFNLISSGNTDIYVLKQDSHGNFIWAIRIGGSGSDFGTSIKLDRSGNIFLAGIFSQIVDFDPGPVTQTLAVGQQNSEGFICQLKQNGQFVWVKQFGADMNQNFSSEYLVLDIDTSGNVHAAGSFKGLLNIGPGLITFTSVASSFDIFICTFANTGNFLWANQTGGPGLEAVKSITSDYVGNIILTGVFSATTDFDPGPATYPLIATPLGFNGFVSKLSSTGNFVWARQITGTCYGPIASTNNFGEVILTGSFNSYVDLDPGTSTYSSSPTGTNANGFVSKLDSFGNFMWGRFFKSTGFVNAYCLAVDQANNIYACGRFHALTDFDAVVGSYSLAPASSQGDMYLCKLDNAGTSSWVRSVGGVKSTVPFEISMDVSANLYITGAFDSIVDFDPDPPVFYQNSAGSSDIFVLKLSLCNDVPITPCQSNNVCAGDSVVLNTTALGFVSWYASATSTTSIGTGTIFQTPTLSAGNFTYFVASSSCTLQGTRAQVLIQVKTLPTVNITAVTQTICTGNQIQLTASGAQFYLWNTAAQGPTISVNPSHTTIFSVTGTDTTWGCKSNKNFTVNVSPCLEINDKLYFNLMKIYPNPADDFLIVESENDFTLILYNALGQSTFKQQFKRGKNLISLNDYKEGIYFMEITQEDKISKIKLVRK